MLKIIPKHTYTSNLNSRNQKQAKNPSFTAAGACISKAEEILVEKALISQHLGLLGRGLNKLSETAGEIQNILFIGFGTAFVAPIFIAYNKLAKEDSRTKKYSALRQPISAVITVATGLGINYPIAKWFNKASAEGKLSTFDMTAKPPSDLLKSSYKNISKKLEKHGAEGLNRLNKFDKQIMDSINADLKGEKIIDSVEEFKKVFSNNQKFESVVHAKTSNAAALKLLDKANPENLYDMSMRDYLVKYLDFEVAEHYEGVLNPDASKSKLKEMGGLKLLKQFGIDNYNESTLRAHIAKNIYNTKFENASEVDKKFAKQICDYIQASSIEHNKFFDDPKKLTASFISKYSKRGFNKDETLTIARIVESFIPEELKNAEKISAKLLLKALGIEKDFYSNKEMLDKKMSDFLLEFGQKMSVKSKAKPLEKLTDAEKFTKLKRMAGNIAKGRAESAASAFKAYSKAQGIFLSLVILPFSCGFLNWSYPRVMEKLFPSLSGVKDVKKGDNK